MPVLRPERIGRDEYHDDARNQPLPPQFLGRARDVHRDGLFEFVPLCDGLTERTGRDDALVVGKGKRQCLARRAAQFQGHALHDDAHVLTQPRRVRVAQVQRRLDAECFELGRKSAGDTPQIRKTELRAPAPDRRAP